MKHRVTPFKPIKGANSIASFARTLMSERRYCKRCGGHIMTNLPTFGLIDVFSATIPSLGHKPALHVNYGEVVLTIRDDLQKFANFPADLGRSGKLIAE